jgi:hypothetical protein
VCLTCGAQKTVIESNRSTLLCYVVILASLAGLAGALLCAPFGGGLLGVMLGALGAPDGVVGTAFVVGSVTTFVVLCFLLWKLVVGAVEMLTKREWVWARGGDMLPMRPMI